MVAVYIHWVYTFGLWRTIGYTLSQISCVVSWACHIAEVYCSWQHGGWCGGQGHVRECDVGAVDDSECYHAPSVKVYELFQSATLCLGTARTPCFILQRIHSKQLAFCCFTLAWPVVATSPRSILRLPELAYKNVAMWWLLNPLCPHLVCVAV